ncbi:MAG: radical SAM protein [Prevotellaceae bacterium]|nr:radical SAM protein [Candidatus Colivivens equi]
MLTRVVNWFQAEISFLLSRWGICRVRHLPTFVSIEPAHTCQLTCPDCALGSGQTAKGGLMPLTTFEHILNQLAPSVHTMQFYFQGEPLLNPDLPKMIALAHKRHIYTVVSTNAQALTPFLAQQLTEAGLNRIIVSIDGFSQKSYEQYRKGGSLHEAMDGLQYLHDAQQGHQPWIELQVLRLRSNEHEWDFVRHNYRHMGANSLTFKTAQFIDFENGNPLMPSNPKYCRYEQQADGRYHLKHSRNGAQSTIHNPLSTPCHRLWTGCVITTTGEVLPCCYDKQSRYSFGNILQQDIQTIYHSDKAQSFRRRVLKGNAIDICQNCGG